MTIREHAFIFWGMVRRWPRATAVVLAGLAVLYFLYYAGVEALSIPDSIAAGLGMALMGLFLKTSTLFLFYRLFHHGAFEGSFLILSAFSTVPLIGACATAMLLALDEGMGPPPEVIPFLLLGGAVFISVALGALARVNYWIGGGGLKRR